MDITVAMLQPTGHAIQIPVEPKLPEKTMASTTRKIRSVKVAAMKRPISPIPRRIPSAASLADTTK